MRRIREFSSNPWNEREQLLPSQILSIEKGAALRAAEQMSGNLNISAQKATEEIFEIFGMRPVGAQGEKVAQAIEQVIVGALKISVERSTEAAKEACSSDREMSKQIVQKINHAHTVLIANLSAMR